MEPLSILKYIKNNLNKIVAQVISIALGTAIIYFLFTFGGGYMKNISRLLKSPLEDKAVYMNSKTTASPGEFKKCYSEVKRTKGVEKVFDASMTYTSMKTSLGAIGCRIIGLKKADINYMFKKEKYELTKGRMPRYDGEILANEDYARSRGYKINQYVGNDVDSSESIEGKKKIVGLFRSDQIIAYYVDKSLDKKQNVKGFLAVFNNPKAMSTVRKKYNQDLTVVDKAFFAGFADSFESAFIGFGILIVFIILVIEWIILNNLMYINLLSRRETLALMCAVGMGKKEVKGRVLKEQGTIILIGFILGIIIGILGVQALNLSYLNPHGQGIGLFSPIYMSGSICLVIVIFITSRLPLRKFFKNTDIVGILEGR